MYGPDTSSLYETSNRQEIVERLDVDYLLQGNLTIDDQSLVLEVFLIDALSGQYVWADVLEQPVNATSINTVRDQVADEVARILAQPYGIIQSCKTSDDDGEKASEMGAYRCVLRFHRYWRTFDPSLFEPVRQCLEHTTLHHPFYAEAFACLSQIYTNAFRYQHDVSRITEDPRTKALDLAFRAIELAPRSSQSYFAMGLAYWFIGDIDSSFEAYEKARLLNPNDTKTTGELGFRYAMRMEWEKAVPLITESYDRNPGQSGTFRMGLSLYHYAEGRYDQSIIESRKIDAPNIPYQYLISAACNSRLGDTHNAQTTLAKLLEISPRFGDVIVDNLQARSLHPDLIIGLVEDVARAGLTVSNDQLQRIKSAI